MTARAGDALSHVNFLHRVKTPFLSCHFGHLKCSAFDHAAGIATGPSRAATLFRPYLHGGHERSGRNRTGPLFSLALYLRKSCAANEDYSNSK